MTEITPNVWVEVAARVCHEANRAIQIANEDPAPSPAWDDAPLWQKASALEGVVNALNGQTPEELHRSWVHHKLASGWVYGPMKDEVRRQHPCIVSYDELPPEQRLKDDVFRSVVRAFKDAAVLG